MNWLVELVTNPYIITAVGSWIVAQVLKTILYAIVNGKFDIMRLFGDGGMPSGHSATVASLAVITCLLNGVGSFEFATALILAIIVCHDAMGVRQETGKQAILLDEIVVALEELTNEDLPEVKLKKFVGHTPIQVCAGILVGVSNAAIMYFVL